MSGCNSFFYQQKFQANENYMALKEGSLMSNIPLKEISLPANIFEKKMVSFCKGLLDVTTNVYPESCTYHPDTVCRTLCRRN